MIKYGINAIDHKRKTGFLPIFLSQPKSPIILIFGSVTKKFQADLTVKPVSMAECLNVKSVYMRGTIGMALMILLMSVKKPIEYIKRFNLDYVNLV